MSLITQNFGPLLTLPFNKNILDDILYPSIYQSCILHTVYLEEQLVTLSSSQHIYQIYKNSLWQIRFYILKTYGRCRKLQKGVLCGVFLVRRRWLIMLAYYEPALYMRAAIVPPLFEKVITRGMQPESCYMAHMAA